MYSMHVHPLNYQQISNGISDFEGKNLSQLDNSKQ